MAKNNNKAGEDFQNQVWDDWKTTSELLSLTENDQLIDIDSKDPDNDWSEKRSQIRDLYIKKFGKMDGIHSAAAIRGDVMKSNIHGEFKNQVIDLKNYDKAQGQMKLPGFSNSDFMKGIDSNIKYMLHYLLDTFDFSDNVLHELKGFYFSTDSDMNWYNQFCGKYQTETKIGTITKDNFVSVFSFMELGYGWEMVDLSPIKSFISRTDDNRLEYKEIDFSSTLIGTDLDVKLSVDNKGYVNILFYQGIECVYILSQRGPGGSKPFGSNCSFINKSFSRLVKTIQIPN